MDEERGHYQLLKIGWHQGKRVEWMMIYARIKDGKIWIEKDLTEDGIATELLEAGVPKQHIVLAFHEPELRRYTEFAAAYSRLHLRATGTWGPYGCHLPSWGRLRTCPTMRKPGRSHL
jgi:hypothetical protein